MEAMKKNSKYCINCCSDLQESHGLTAPILQPPGKHLEIADCTTDEQIEDRLYFVFGISLQELVNYWTQDENCVKTKSIDPVAHCLNCSPAFALLFEAFKKYKRFSNRESALWKLINLKSQVLVKSELCDLFEEPCQFDRNSGSVNTGIQQSSKNDGNYSPQDQLRSDQIKQPSDEDFDDYEAEPVLHSPSDYSIAVESLSASNSNTNHYHKYATRGSKSGDKLDATVDLINTDLIKNERPKNLQYQCSHCSKTFYCKAVYKKHEMKHTGKKRVTCTMCGRYFNDAKLLEIHQKVHTEIFFTCTECGECFEGKRLLTKHVKLHLGNKLKIQKKKKNQKSNPKEENKPFVCTVCGKGFQLKNGLSHHMFVHPEERIKEYSCDVCNKIVSNLSALKSHKATHSGEKPFTCSFCNKKFARRTNLKLHERIHSDIRPFQCTFCDEAFKYNFALKKHERSHHIGNPNKPKKLRRSRKCKKDKPYLYLPSCNSSTQVQDNQKSSTDDTVHKCKICEKEYKTPCRLRMHERIHTGEKPYQCKLCDQKFRFPQSVKNHIMLHTGEKPHSCKFCSKTFRLQQVCQTHERTHTGEKPFACKICDKLFNTLIQTKEHEKTHTGEKPHLCEDCGKCFTSKYILINHRRIHTGEKPFACKICEESFAYRHGLRNHQKTLGHL